MPYPFQNNIAVLDKEKKARCLDDLIDAALEARARSPSDKPKNFDGWNVRNVGNRLNEIFSKWHSDWLFHMISCDLIYSNCRLLTLSALVRPYNFKVWAVPTSKVRNACTLGKHLRSPADSFLF